MREYRVITIVIALVVSAPLWADSLQLDAGITVEPPAGDSYTFQIVKEYDPSKKVIAGWNGDKLQFIVSLSKLPPGWLDAKTYLTGFAKDIRDMSAPQKFELLRQGTYNAGGKLIGHYAEMVFTVRGTDVSQRKIVHHLTDSKSSYIAIATLIDIASAENMLDESVAILKTATISSIATEQVSHEYDKYLGKWMDRESSPAGQPTEALVEFKSDLSFVSTVSVDGKLIFRATGIWSLRDNVLAWNYLNSAPALPEDAKVDADEIVSADSHSLRLRSKRTGAIHEFQHVL